MRLRNNPKAFQELLESNILIQKFPHKISKKTVIELGMGKGEMITSLAKINPNFNYLGIEKFPTIAHKAMIRAQKKELKNFNIICDDISKINSLLEGQVEIIWLTFSDPWPKKRHAKRRLTHINFINMYKKLLTKKGVIKLKTDNDLFFNWTIDHLQNEVNISNITNDFHKHKSSKDNIMTGYEKKWSSNGKKINYLEIRF